jgi:hypothetical protein
LPDEFLVLEEYETLAQALAEQRTGAGDDQPGRERALSHAASDLPGGPMARR